jgi:hypothetical protein
MNPKRYLWKSVLLVGALLVLASQPAVAHQPFFEEVESTAAAPWLISDPSTSLALYFSLERPGDVDYFVFDGTAGQAILLSIVIPQIKGQENFTPTLALLGPGLPVVELPHVVEQPLNTGAYILRASSGKASTFFEPFSRTGYWQRQQERATLPADGQYWVAIWSESGQVGRYTFSPGDRERFGGDAAFARKLRTYWTPVPSPTRSGGYPCGG